MDRWVRIQALAVTLLALAVAVPVCGAAEVELSATNKSADANANVTSYSGEVTLKIPAGTEMQLRARAMKRDNGVEIVRGDVEIKLPTMIVRTQQASVARNEQFTLVKMDAAEVTTLSP